MMMNMMNNGMSGWGMMLLPFLFWVMIIAGIVLIVIWLAGHKKESALEILKRRYALGEIDKLTFDRMKKDIAEGEGS
jgi:putative membrane protein